MPTKSSPQILGATNVIPIRSRDDKPAPGGGDIIAPWNPSLRESDALGIRISATARRTGSDRS